MGKPLKILLSVACVAVTAYVIYFFWLEFREGPPHQAAVAPSATDRCLLLLDSIAAGQPPEPWRDPLDDCIDSRAISRADLVAAGLGHLAPLSKP